ncbi:MAG: ROK family protein [Phycisphaerales bacterium]|nr:ROK family protein [Phycisphaerales bacterium]
MKLAIGVDLGGTDIKVGVMDRPGVLLKKATLPTRAADGPDQALDRLAEHIRELARRLGLRTDEIAAIGVGAPGPIDRDAGVLIAAPNLPGWENTKICPRLSVALGAPVSLENDANAAAFGEFAHRIAAGERISSMVLFTLGTGVGGGVVIDRRLVRGSYDSAGEIGHMIVEADGRKCPCGQSGCLERYASATGISATFQERGGAAVQMTRDICSKAERGDPIAMGAFDVAAKMLAIAIINLQHLLNPELIALGGGVAAAGNVLLEPVRRYARELTWRLVDDLPRIELAVAGNDAGMLGAAALALTNQQ